jgi:hypothetical protein
MPVVLEVPAHEFRLVNVVLGDEDVSAHERSMQAFTTVKRDVNRFFISSGEPSVS